MSSYASSATPPPSMEDLLTPRGQEAFFRLVLEAAVDAGHLIEEIGPVDIQVKKDGSRVTKADLKSADLLRDRLTRAFPGALVETEEDPDAGHGHPDARREDSRQWMFHVDPLDATEAFIQRRTAAGHTVLVGLRRGPDPVAGVMVSPADGMRAWFGGPGLGAYHSPDGCWESRVPVSVRQPSPEVGAWHLLLSHSLRRIVAKAPPPCEVAFMPSARKFGLVAAGEGDLHFRRGNTCWWDILAGDAVVRGGGGQTYDLALLSKFWRSRGRGGSPPAPFDLQDAHCRYIAGCPGPDLLAVGAVPDPSHWPPALCAWLDAAASDT